MIAIRFIHLMEELFVNQIGRVDRFMLGAGLALALCITGCGGDGDASAGGGTTGNAGTTAGGTTSGGTGSVVRTITFSGLAAKQFPTYAYRASNGGAGDPKAFVNADGNVDSSFNGAVTITQPDGTRVDLPAVSGVVNLRTLKLPATLGSSTLQASASNGASGSSGSFTVRPLHVVTGRLIEGNGSPTVGFVTLSSTDGQNFALTVNGGSTAGGGTNYQFNDVPAGSYDVETWGFGNTHEIRTLSIPDNETVPVSGPGLTVRSISTNNTQFITELSGNPTSGPRGTTVSFSGSVDGSGGVPASYILIGTASRRLVARGTGVFPFQLLGTAAVTNGDDPIGSSQYIMFAANDGSKSNSFSAVQLQVTP